MLRSAHDPQWRKPVSTTNVNQVLPQPAFHCSSATNTVASPALLQLCTIRLNCRWWHLIAGTYNPHRWSRSHGEDNCCGSCKTSILLLPTYGGGFASKKSSAKNVGMLAWPCLGSPARTLNSLLHTLTGSIGPLVLGVLHLLNNAPLLILLALRPPLQLALQLANDLRQHQLLTKPL